MVVNLWKVAVCSQVERHDVKMKDERDRDVDDWSQRQKTTEELLSNNTSMFEEPIGWRSEATWIQFLTGKEFTQSQFT